MAQELNIKRTLGFMVSDEGARSLVLTVHAMPSPAYVSSIEVRG